MTPTGTANPPTTFMGLVQGVPAVTAALTAAIAALLPLVLPDGLLPEQLVRLKPVFSLTMLAALLLTWAFRHRLRRWLKSLIVVLAAAILVLVALHTELVKEVPYYGDPPAPHRFLTGYRMTERGQAAIAAVGAEGLGIEEQIRRVGDDQIPLLYGTSYRIAAATYVLATVALAVALVLTIGAIELDVRRRPS